MEDRQLSHEDSLSLIGSMLLKAKNSYHDNGYNAMLWGSVIAICSLVSFFQLKGWMKLGFDIWWLAVVAIIPTIYFSVRQRRKQKAVSYENSYLNVTWIAYGIAIGLLTFVMGKISAAPGSAVIGEYWIPLYLILYGIPTLITGMGSKVKLMVAGAAACWAGAIITCFTTLPTDMLIMGVCACLAWLIPGIDLYRKNSRNAHV